MTLATGGPAFVVVSGAPGSGKSTLAAALAPALELPLLAKDTVKQALMEVLDVPDVETSQRIGRASVAVLLAAAAESGGAVLDSVWYRSQTAAALARLPGTIVEVHCRCDRETAAARYRERAGSRASGHRDAERSPDELWNEEVARPVAGGWPVLEVDTTVPVDVTELVDALRRQLLGHQPQG